MLQRGRIGEALAAVLARAFNSVDLARSARQVHLWQAQELGAKTRRRISTISRQPPGPSGNIRYPHDVFAVFQFLPSCLSQHTRLAARVRGTLVRMRSRLLGPRTTPALHAAKYSLPLPLKSA